MKHDAVSFVPHRPFRAEAGTTEFETDKYYLSLDQAITLHLKVAYLDGLLGDTPLEQRQIRKWYFYTAHLNGLYLLLDSCVLRELNLSYFSIEEVTTQNADVVSGTGVSISPHSHRSLVAPSHEQPLIVTKRILELINRSFCTATSDYERIYVLSEATKSVAAYKSADFTTSFVLGWFLLERFVESRWASYLEVENRELDHGQKRINAERRKSLNDARSYPVSVKLQLLELAGKLSFRQFSDLDMLRGKRNEIVHPKKTQNGGIAGKGDPGICTKAFELLQEFLESDFDLRVTFNRSYSHLGVFDR